jgi:hypothetical protein
MKKLSFVGLAVFGILVFVAATTAVPTANSTNDAKMAVALLLDGQPLNQTELSTVSSGVLTVNSLESDSKMPFRIYLKRGDQKLSFGGQTNGKEQYEAEIGFLVSRARFGDALVVETVGNAAENQKPKVVFTKYLFPLNFTKMTAQNGDGC